MQGLVESSESEKGECQQEEDEEDDDDYEPMMMTDILELIKKIHNENYVKGKKKKQKKGKGNIIKEQVVQQEDEEEFEKVKSKRQRKRDNRKKNIKVKKGDIEGNKGVTKENENIVKDMYELNEELDKKIEYYQEIINKEDMNKELKILQAIEPEGFNAVGEAEPEWQDIEFAVDSGATESVINEEMLPAVPITESEASKRGVKYEVANGVRIPNLGQKQFDGITDDESLRNLKVQVCDVNKALLSVKKITNAGNRVIFDNEGSYIEDKLTGEKMWLREEGGMYMLRMWVRNPFTGLGK